MKTKKHGFAVVSLPLPVDHWSKWKAPEDSPAPWRTGNGPRRHKLAGEIRQAGRYAYQATRMDKDSHDPDAFIQNLIVGLLGYWTHDGTRDGKL